MLVARTWIHSSDAKCALKTKHFFNKGLSDSLLFLQGDCHLRGTKDTV